MSHNLVGYFVKFGLALPKVEINVVEKKFMKFWCPLNFDNLTSQ